MLVIKYKTLTLVSMIFFTFHQKLKKENNKTKKHFCMTQEKQYENVFCMVFANFPKIQFKCIKEIYFQKMANETLK